MSPEHEPQGQRAKEIRRRTVLLGVSVSLWCGVLGLAQDHGYTPADIENGARLYQSSCAGCHGAAGDAIPGVDLARGEFRRATSDTDLVRIIQSGLPNTAMPPHAFSEREAATVVAYVRSMGTTAAAIGDPSRGRALFEGKGGCAVCHRVYGRGPRLAPDLSDVGATRSLRELREALVDPGATIRPANRFVRAVTTGGDAIEGRLLNQDSFSIQLLDANERLRSLSKTTLRQYGVLQTSPMPSYQDALTNQELDDVVGYLTTLRGVIP